MSKPISTTKAKMLDHDAIQTRAESIYGRLDRPFPFALLGHGEREALEDAAADELWDENALNFAPAGVPRWLREE